MASIQNSAKAFEDWQRGRLHVLFVEADLDEKHKKMRASPFSFLRASYWRWAEVVVDALPHVMTASPVLAVGDSHLENFGTWRDSEGRLVWGANDFDDAAVMPWPLDLIRLAASALLARQDDADAGEIAKAILDGYRAGLTAPAPVVLERDHAWLRTELLLAEDERTAFWAKFDQMPDPIPQPYAAALAASLPPGAEPPLCFARTAGTGSLGKPRFVALLKHWQGGPVLREAKALLPSAWALAGGAPSTPIRTAEIAHGPFRAADPHFQVQGDILVRRLSPSSRKIEVKAAGTILQEPRMLSMMGFEIANCHAGTSAMLPQVRAEAQAKDDRWLQDAAEKMARVVTADYRDFR